jgi:hypothetical protein
MYQEPALVQGSMSDAKDPRDEWDWYDFCTPLFLCLKTSNKQTSQQI